MEKKTVQFPRYLIRKKKNEAIADMVSYINAHSGEFMDGEEITLRYYDNYNNIVSVNAVVDKPEGGLADISVEIGEHDTLKIVESDTEPEDKSVLWLTEISGETETTSGVSAMFEYMKEEIKSLKELVEKHDYALSSTIAGGDIITNSEKYDEEMEYDPEMPEDAKDYGSYATEDFVVVDFDVYLGNSPFSIYYESTPLYKGQKYNLKIRYFNKEGEIVRAEDATNVTSYSHYTSDIEVADFIADKDVLLATKKGSVKITFKVLLLSGRNLEKDFNIYFTLNEEPYYERYSEPNVHHMLIKNAETYDILSANTDYLCVGEFIWCVGNNTLYLKEKASNGTIQVFKISGSGGSITGETGETVSYEVDNEGTLIGKGDELVVDSEGRLNLEGTIDENGILSLDNVTGSTGGGGDEPSDDDYEVDDEGEMTMTGPDISVDDEGTVSINGVINDGILEL